MKWISIALLLGCAPTQAEEPSPYGMKCERVVSLKIGQLYRCENKEVVCYWDGYEGGLQCKFKEVAK